jgi:hypothetical protein
MKKLICCLFVSVIAVITAGAQDLLVPESNFSVVPREGQSEIIINFIGTQSILVSINGVKTMHLMPGEITKFVINNGSVSIEAETFYYTSKTGWARWGRTASFDINPYSQSVQIRISNRANGNITISQMSAKPLEMQIPAAQPQNVYSSSNIENIENEDD